MRIQREVAALSGVPGRQHTNQPAATQVFLHGQRSEQTDAHAAQRGGVQRRRGIHAQALPGLDARGSTARPVQLPGRRRRCGTETQQQVLREIRRLPRQSVARQIARRGHQDARAAGQLACNQLAVRQ
ncbi:hypothetical protein G6F68_009702 [Rhizopus microsporus]|nr:hypothetical protein G6F68_009702 [Rhizopus microsporus]